MSKHQRDRSESLSESQNIRKGKEPAMEEVQMPEAGPSRLQYPPEAHITSRAEDRFALRSSHSSSSLFWNSTNDRNLPVAESDHEEERDTHRIHRRRSNVAFAERKGSLIGREKDRSAEAASITSTKSSNGGWTDWLTGKSARAAERAEASKRLGKKLKRAEARSRLKKQMASRDTRRSTTSFDIDSDSDVVVTRGDDIIRPDVDVPPPNDTTANALSRVASRVKQSRAPRLHFAPEERKIRKKDLPLDYEQGELYRGLDEYVQASRERRRSNRKKERRRGSRSSRASRSSHSKSSVSSGGSSSSSSDSDSDDGSSSTGSSSSSASGRLTMARLRAFFGDSSSDSSTSSSSDDNSSSTSSTRSNRNASRDNLSNSSDDTRSTTSKATFRLFRRRRSTKPTGESDEEDSPPPTPRMPRTPALPFQIKGGAERRRKRKAAQRYRAQEKRLIEEGKIPPKPSRKARKKAKLARLQAGGITEYTLFTPVALAHIHEKEQQSHSTRPSIGARGFTMQRVDTVDMKAIKDAPPERVLSTVSFAAIKGRLHALRRYRRQIDNAAGDLGMPVASLKKIQKSAPRKSQEVVASGEDHIAAGGVDDEFDFEEGDLSLPPPALDLPQEEEALDDASSTEKRRRRRQTTEWHMSDVPLTPHIQMATDFARGFEVGEGTRRSHFTPTLATQHESGNNDGTSPSDRPSSSENNASSKGPSGLSSTTALNSPRGTAHAAWWLDINCPTYRDMTELSKMFPLHPLTVEDILQQDTREKVEVFESLNYYFVVVRAIDEKYFKFTPSTATRSDATIAEINNVGLKMEKQSSSLEGDLEMKELRSEISADATTKGRVDIIERPDEQEGLEGVSVGAINLYLIVFSHGVISFHFEDVSKHTDHVRRRLLDLTQPVELTSDWIAHGIFDSIVDAFSPLLTFVQTEVEDIERLADEPLPRNKKEAALARRNKLIGMEKKTCKKHDTALPVWVIHEKRQKDVLRFAPFIPIPTVLVNALPPLLITKKEFIYKEKVPDDSSPPRTGLQRMFGLGKHRAHQLTAFQSNSAQEQKVMLRRITETRKIVTGLSRLLTPKNDSVRGLRKRLVDLRSPSISTTEMSIYMGDVHDHIVTMLSLLSSDDHRLSDTHLSYLSVIRMTNSLTSHSKDEVLVFLATITITIVSTIFLCSLVSFNVHVPMNIHGSSTYHWFGGIVAGAGIIPFLTIVRTYTWLQQAKAKSAARQAVR